MAHSVIDSQLPTRWLATRNLLARNSQVVGSQIGNRWLATCNSLTWNSQLVGLQHETSWLAFFLHMYMIFSLIFFNTWSCSRVWIFVYSLLCRLYFFLDNERHLFSILNCKTFIFLPRSLFSFPSAEVMCLSMLNHRPSIHFQINLSLITGLFLYLLYGQFLFSHLYLSTQYCIFWCSHF